MYRDDGYGHCRAEVCHAEAGPGAQDPHAVEPNILSPVAIYGYDRRTDSSGNPLWVPNGTGGYALKATGPGGAANPAELLDKPGYAFAGAQRFYPGAITTSAQWTFLFWFYCANVANFEYPVGLGGLSGILATVGGNIGFYDGVGLPLYSSVPITSLSIHMAALVRDGTTYTLVQDGDVVASDTRVGVAISDLTFGRRSDGVLDFNGGIMEPEIVEISMSEAAINGRFQQGRHRYGV